MSSTRPDYFNHRVNPMTYSCMRCGLYEDFLGYVKSCPAGEFAWKEHEKLLERKAKVEKSRGKS